LRGTKLGRLLKTHYREIGRRRRVKRVWYTVFIAPCLTVMLLGVFFQNDFVKWVGSIALGGALASVVGTEITLWQIEHLGFGSGIIRGFLETPLGIKTFEMLEKLDSLLSRVDEKELDNVISEVRKMVQDARRWWVEGGGENLAGILRGIRNALERKQPERKVVVPA